jgi:Ca-activated chloride channel homolog
MTIKTLDQNAISRAAVHLFALSLLSLLVAYALAAQTRATPTAFRISARMVLVPVAVTDYHGKTVEGLQAQNFTIFDDRAPQRIISLTNEDAPCSVGIVLDVSASMKYILADAKAVARTFFATANPNDEFQLLTVSTQPAGPSRFTRDVGFLEQNIESTGPKGLTALIDTIYLGLTDMRAAKWPHRALLVISDGIDNHSRYSKTDLLRAALEADVQVYTILVGWGPASAATDTVGFRPILLQKPWEQALQREGPFLLEAVSNLSGGIAFRARNDAEAKQTAIKVGQAIRSQYVIGYQAPRSGSTGKWHHIQVKSDVPRVSVHARSGYYSQ